ncbi:MAG: hypothetical protein ACRBCS_06175 [Cellvibrionaceae bacterium]
MKLIKYFAGSLIISLGILIVMAIFTRAIGVTVPEEYSRYFIVVWVLLALLILPWARKIIRV